MALGVATVAPSLYARKPQKVVIVGGGWGGLSAARHLRLMASELDITLLERNPAFWSCPLSNHWLVGRIENALLERNYAVTAHKLGYRFVQTEASNIDRDARQVITPAGRFDYDWLILALGIRHDYRAWFGDDVEAAGLAQRHYPPAWTAGPEFALLRNKLQTFRGGDLLMTIPPAPYRCPPAIFERAVLIAGWLDARKVPGRIVIIDPNPPFQEFQRIFREEHSGRIVYRSQTPITGIDLKARIAKTEFEDFGFDDAVLMPPQQAATLAWQADLIGRDSTGLPTGWAAVDPLRLTSKTADHIFVIGDMADRVSGLFGYYPKSGQIAIRQGRSIARQIAAAVQGKSASPELPESICHIATRYEPPAALRLAFNYRIRGDGELLQQMKTERDRQPRGEDLAWLQSMFAEMFD